MQSPKPKEDKSDNDVGSYGIILANLNGNEMLGSTQTTDERFALPQPLIPSLLGMNHQSNRIEAGTKSKLERERHFQKTRSSF